MGITPDSILNKQSKEGYWPGFPKTSNLTNFIVIDSIKKYECKEALEKIKEWTLNHKAKDGIGWGLNDDDKDSQVSFTVNALLTLLPCKESAKSKDIEKAIEFLESKQIKDGGWPSSNLTYPAESTTYATSLVCLILLRTKDINSKNKESLLHKRCLKESMILEIRKTMRDFINSTKRANNSKKAKSKTKLFCYPVHVLQVKQTGKLARQNDVAKKENQAKVGK